jgi:hypothetical protein
MFIAEGEVVKINHLTLDFELLKIWSFNPPFPRENMFHRPFSILVVLWILAWDPL